MMEHLVESASASSIECVVKIIEASLLFVAIADITFHMNRLASGSIPVEGSSSKITGGFPIMAIPTESLRLFPPDNSPAQTFSNLN